MESDAKKLKWRVWSPRDQPLRHGADECLPISICTTCMGRTDDLKATLAQNIADNEGYPNLEFVVLNYNSQDDMHAFMTSGAVLPYINIGRVKYLRTRIPRFYSSAHSKNIAFRNASGKIVTSVDADNFTGKGFAEYLNRLAEICPEKAMFARGKRRIHGRIGMYKAEFDSLGGYDEDLDGYGFDDHSLMMRAMASEYTLMWWARGSGVEFANRIWTSRERIVENMANTNWKETEHRNTRITMEKLSRRELVANAGKKWGFVEDLEVYA